MLGSDQKVTAVRNGDTVTITPSGGPTNDIATVIEITVRTAAPAGRARGRGLAAAFWPNATFSGEPTVRRTDPTVNYNWKFTGPPPFRLASGTRSPLSTPNRVVRRR